MNHTAAPEAVPDDLSQGGARKEERSKRRPRLLFLARPFPPARRSSCTRTWNIAKHLSRLGWDVTVVTPDPSVWRRLENESEFEEKIRREGIARILTDHRWRWLQGHLLKCWNEGLGWVMGGVCRVAARRLGIDDGIGWVSAAEQACSGLAKGDIDLILGTAMPVSAFKLAKKLSKRLECPYVMDYRDPWTQNPHATHKARPQLIEEERRLLAGSAAVTIVSRSWAEAMNRQHGLGSKLHVISNGYDPEDMARVEPVEFGHFAIVYAGVLYPPKRVITPVMNALKRVQDGFTGTAGEYYFHYYGPHQESVYEEAQRAGVTERVVLHGLVSRTEALAAVKGASVDVVITSVADEASREERGIVTGKIFEAIGAGTPILLICPSGSDAEIVLSETGLGQAFRGGDTDGIAAFFRDLMSGKGVKAANPAGYSWPHIAVKLDRVLRGILENSFELQLQN